MAEPDDFETALRRLPAGYGNPGFATDPHAEEKETYEYPEGSGQFYEIQSDAKGQYIIDADKKRHDFVYAQAQEVNFDE